MNVCVMVHCATHTVHTRPSNAEYTHVTFSLKLIDLFKPETYNYLLGDSILVAPVLSDPSDVSVTFPEGQWVAWWNDSLVYKEGDVAKFAALPLEVFPAFIKASVLRLQLCVSDCGAGPFVWSVLGIAAV